MEIKPSANNVLLEPLEDASQNSAGVYLPETSKDKPQKGKVLSVGKDVVDVKVGTYVFYKKWTSNEIKEDKLYIIVEEKDILASYV